MPVFVAELYRVMDQKAFTGGGALAERVIE